MIMDDNGCWMGLSCQAQGFHSSVAVKCSPTPTRMLMLPGFPLQRCCKE